MKQLFRDVLHGMGSLLESCNHILEEKIPKDDISYLLSQADLMTTQSDTYRAELRNQSENSRSGVSREIATQILDEDIKVTDLIQKAFPECEMISEDGEDVDLNVGALYEEYLTGRAMQAIREAIIGAIHLKMIQNEKEDPGPRSNNQ